MDQKLGGAAYQAAGRPGWARGCAYRVVPFLSFLLTIACSGRGVTPEPAPAPVSEPPLAASPTPAPRPAPAAPDGQLEKKLARAELQLIEKDAQIEELQLRLDDARREVVRAMAK